MKHMQDCYTLQNGVLIPCMAFGTYKTAEGDGTAVIRTAIEARTSLQDTSLPDRLWQYLPPSYFPWCH